MPPQGTGRRGNTGNIRCSQNVHRVQKPRNLRPLEARNPGNNVPLYVDLATQWTYAGGYGDRP
jgi:hypothetical protein